MIDLLRLAMIEKYGLKSVNQLPGAVPNSTIKEGAGAWLHISLETYYESTQTLSNHFKPSNPTKSAEFYQPSCREKFVDCRRSRV